MNELAVGRWVYSQPLSRLAQIARHASPDVVTMIGAIVTIAELNHSSLGKAKELALYAYLVQSYPMN
jgi:hypothetical protein